MTVKLSKHFVENWERRVGGMPTPALVNEIIRRSVFVQRGKELRTKKGEPFRMLAIYWHPDLDIVLRIDTADNVAVSVLSRENAPQSTRRAINGLDHLRN
jgi:hypothetical protein